MKNEDVKDETISLKAIEFPSNKTFHVEPSVLESYTGKYEKKGMMSISVETGDSKLAVSFPGRGTFYFYPTSKTEFYMNEVKITLTFNVNNDKADHVVFNMGGQKTELVKLN